MREPRLSAPQRAEWASLASGCQRRCAIPRQHPFTCPGQPSTGGRSGQGQAYSIGMASGRLMAPREWSGRCPGDTLDCRLHPVYSWDCSAHAVGYVAGHRLHEESPGQRGRRQYGSIEPAAPPGLPHRPGHGDKQGTMGRMDGAAWINIKPGLRVSIVLKPDQRSRKLTAGVVKDMLTHASTHPHGIKVRLETGQVGRVKPILRCALRWTPSSDSRGATGRQSAARVVRAPATDGEWPKPHWRGGRYHG